MPRGGKESLSASSIISITGDWKVAACGRGCERRQVLRVCRHATCRVCCARRFVSVSDAVDGLYFDPALARPLDRPEGGLVLLPGPVADGKATAPDLPMSACDLALKGLNITLAFAGPADVSAESLRADLLQEIASLELAGRVWVLGQFGSHTSRALVCRERRGRAPELPRGSWEGAP